MKRTPHFMLTDVEEVKRLIRQHPWATFVSHTAQGLVASHYPVLLDDDAEELTIVSHFGMPDERLHELGSGEVLVIIQGAHEYVSASWYDEGDNVPTWNHVTAHLYGTPEILSSEENYAMLDRLTTHFEQHFTHGRSLSLDEQASRKKAEGTVGLRMRVTRFDARAKLSQNKSDAVAARVAAQLEHRNAELATEMRRLRPQS